MELSIKASLTSLLSSKHLLSDTLSKIAKDVAIEAVSPTMNDDAGIAADSPPGEKSLLIMKMHKGVDLNRDRILQQLTTRCWTHFLEYSSGRPAYRITDTKMNTDILVLMIY